MDDKNRIVLIDQIHDLKKPAGGRRAPHQKLLVRTVLRIGFRCSINDVFGLLRCHAMLHDLGDVPLDPSELHRPVSINIYIKIRLVKPEKARLRAQAPAGSMLSGFVRIIARNGLLS